ncbi:maltokinase N-terminal cap-like domain-containing protein [Microbacterium dextranolyticum]|uniref:maltokinase N-terminal cap-like domain-containing protein n=1 Tax=Microbacterium dextranolyticum TaxID=36806 RepID=UPI001EF7E8E9|nr:phosphotransferase [Microbacterium dextranolyticum]
MDHATLEAYLVRTRWFAGKGRPFTVTDARTLGVLSGRTALPDVAVCLVTVTYTDDEDGSERYQVPLALYDEIEDRIGHAYVGPTEYEGRTRHLYDALHDRDSMQWWLDGFVGAEPQGSTDVGGLRFRRVSGGDALDPGLRSSPMTGEQSNSSVRFDDVAIMKLFRKVSPGVNPDIEIHDELTRAGSPHVATLYGWVETEVDGQTVQLAMLQEFLRTATDGFELALGSVRTLLADPEQGVDGSGGDFAGEAARLGEALADVHDVLRQTFPAERRGRDSTAELARAMSTRLDAALRVVPDLAHVAPRLRALYAAVSDTEGLDVQRIHGDLHLGQTLRTAHGWRIVDFEGEPGRPFEERSLPDSPLRDVAGMLRSFDYATGVVEMSRAPSSAQERGERSEQARRWSERAQRSFVDAYLAALDEMDGGARSDRDALARRTLLDAYVADKAVYEVVYEARNRPAWAPIPMGALTDLAER